MAISPSQTVLQFTDANGDLRTLQCDLNDVDYGGGRSIGKQETFCAVEKSPGNPDNTISVTGVLNTDAGRSHKVFFALKTDQTARLYKYGPAGSGSGALLLSGLSYLVDYRIKATAGSSVTTVTAKFEIQGNDHESTW